VPAAPDETRSITSDITKELNVVPFFQQILGSLDRRFLKLLGVLKEYFSTLGTHKESASPVWIALFSLTLPPIKEHEIFKSESK